MKRMRVLWAGATLLLALFGCSNNNNGKEIQGGGVYSPIITGIQSNHEPAIRGAANELTVLVTNVNNYPLTYHWMAGAGSLAESTSATVTWTAPDSIGSFPVTVSIEADDGAGTHFFKSTTFQIFVENEYVRWTESSDVQFDEAPTASGGVIFAQFRNIATGESDIYTVTAAGLSMEQLTQGFERAYSPTVRADGLTMVFAGRVSPTDTIMLWIAPAAGANLADPSTTYRFTAPKISPSHRIVGNPRFSPTSNWLLYDSDSTSGGSPRLWYRQVVDSPISPEKIVTAPNGSYWTSNWGPDVDHDGLPDSVICQGISFFGQNGQLSRGLVKFASAPGQSDTEPWLADLNATEPDWSPDGHHIVFVKPNLEGARDIWIINAASSNPNDAIRVTKGPADDSHPRFSPDGTKIYFLSNRVSKYGLNGVYDTERRGTNIWTVARFDKP
jgi:hypothetical protein